MHKVLEAVRNAPEVFYHGKRWQYWYDNELREGQTQIDIDQFLLEQHFEENISATIRIWQNHPCLVLSKRDLRHCHNSDALQHFDEKGVPLFARSSGGTVVPHGPNVLNISLVFSEKEHKISLTNSYLILCGFVRDVLNGIGLNAKTGNVAGAFCDGEYNLVINDRKIGGTAQRIKKRRNGEKVFLAHMSLLIGGDVNKIIQLISNYYDVTEQSMEFDVDAITTVCRELNNNQSNENIQEFIISFNEGVKAMDN